MPEGPRTQINELDIRLQALEATSLRILTAFDGGDEIGAEPSMLKLKGSELVQAQDELLFTLVDYMALPLDAATGGEAVSPDWAEVYGLRDVTIIEALRSPVARQKCSTTLSPSRCWGFRCSSAQDLVVAS